MALLWLALGWFVLDRPKTGATFVLSGFLFGMLPDVDLVLSNVFPTIKHHGIFHTVLVVTLLALVLGPIVGWVVNKVAGDTDWLSPSAESRVYRFGFIAVWVAGLSHVFADMLSAPDIAESIEPFWPIYPHSLGIDVVWYNNPYFNWGLLVSGIVVNLGLYYYFERHASAGESGVGTV